MCENPGDVEAVSRSKEESTSGNDASHDEGETPKDGAILSRKLRKLCELAALLSLTATTPEARELATMRRIEAATAIDQAQARLDKMREVLALFPMPASIKPEEVRH